MTTVVTTTTTPIPPTQEPLGLPRGSVRGLLSLMITVLFWLLLSLPDETKVQIPVSHYFMLGLVLMFFVSHVQPEERSGTRDPVNFPFHITLIRLLIVGGTAAVVIFQWLNHHDRLMERLTPTAEQIKNWPSYFLATILGLSIGYLFRVLPGRKNWIVQAISAWISILAMLSIVVEILIQAFINPNIKEQIDLVAWQIIVTGLVAFYFGSRV